MSALLSRFAELPGLDARFREERYIALLEAPLVSEGTLRFAPPGKLLRQVTSPAPSTLLISDGRLVTYDGERRREMSLEANPVVRGFVESFVSFLAGDEAALRRLYDMTLTTGESGEVWELTLVPRDAGMRRVLREVRLRGHGVILDEMRIHETSGDRSVTTFTQVDPTRRYSPAEQERVFRVSGGERKRGKTLSGERVLPQTSFPKDF